MPLAALLWLGSITTGAAGPTQHEAAGAGLDERTALALSQAAIGREIGNLRFQAGDGRLITLDALRGKPLVLSLVYTSCYHTCPLTTRNLARVVETARTVLGAATFTVATIGFDVANDTPARMRSFARAQGIADPDWYFLSGDTAALAALMSATGFQSVASPRGYDHLVQTTLVDAEGRVRAQIYGESFEPPLLVEPLKKIVIGGRLQDNTVVDWMNDVRLLCTVYDPASGRYRFDYSIVVTVLVGLLCLGAVGWWIAHAWRQGSGPPTRA